MEKDKDQQENKFKGLNIYIKSKFCPFQKCSESFSTHKVQYMQITSYAN